MKENMLTALKTNTLLLDGGLGTSLQALGMTGSPELWCLEHPEKLADVHRSFRDAGSRAVYTATFGASREKLKEYGREDVAEVNASLARIAKEAVGDTCYIGGDIGPCGRLISPLGDLDFEEAVSLFKEQISALAPFCDFIVIETMIDIREARAALIAAKECCSLPVFVSMTYEDGRTMTGTDPVTALMTLQSLGADAVGCNCSTGPDEMVSLIEAMLPYAAVPLFAKPNAGMPKLIDGKTCFSVGPEEFGPALQKLAKAGASLVGGCCGTTPAHLAAAKMHLEGILPPTPLSSIPPLLSSASRTQDMRAHFIAIGERINPTGKKALQAALLAHDLEPALTMAAEQKAAGASLLDVNVGMPGIDEVSLLSDAVTAISTRCDLPLCIDTTNPDALERALRRYPGRALINSIPAEKGRQERLLTLAKFYGAMFIALPIEESIPETTSDRLAVIENILSAADALDISHNRILVDALVMPVSANDQAGAVTLDIVRACSDRGLLTTMGLSNVSFGLPEREWVNASFLALAMGRGLTSAILNPTIETMQKVRLGSMMILGQDPSCTNYVSYFSKEESKTTGTPLFCAIVDGNFSQTPLLTHQALAQKSPKEVLDDELLPALAEVGERFDKRITFLPQLLQSAQAVQAALDIVEPLLAVDGAPKAGHKVVAATVHGDIHDIGKNIVVLMMKNHGFEVIDLGKDVPTEVIVETAIKENVSLVLLSALITTTMGEMPKVIESLREKGSDIPVMVGGAVITPEYAASIGGHYSRDAMEAVHVAKSLLNLT